MTPYLSDIQSSFTISFNLSRSVLATTLLFSAACIFTVEVHANPMWESTDTRGADQECMCAASLSVELLAMRVIRNRRNARRRQGPPARRTRRRVRAAQDGRFHDEKP